MDIELHLRGKAHELPETLKKLSEALNSPRVSVETPTVDQVLEVKGPGASSTGVDDQESPDIEETTAADSTSAVDVNTPAANAPRDTRGFLHDLRIHTASRGTKANGNWKRKPKVTDADFSVVEAELLLSAVQPELKPPAATTPKPPVAPGTVPIAPTTPAPAAVPTGVAGEITTTFGDIIARELAPDPSFFTDFGLAEGAEFADIQAVVCAFLGMYDPALETQGLAGLTATSEDNLLAIKHGIQIIWPNL